MARPIRIVMADDDERIRGVAKALFEHARDVTLIGLARDGTEAFELTQRLAPDVLVLDLAMPGRPGLDVLIEVGDRCPLTSTVVYSGYPGTTVERAALSLGAAAILPKGSRHAELMDTIRAVAASQARAQVCTAERRIRKTWLVEQDPYGRLSQRERKILPLVALGLSSTKIGELLGSSARTVESQRASLKKKLQIDTPIGIANFAFSRGLVFGSTGDETSGTGR